MAIPNHGNVYFAVTILPAVDPDWQSQSCVQMQVNQNLAAVMCIDASQSGLESGRLGSGDGVGGLGSGGLESGGMGSGGVGVGEVESGG